MTGFVQGTSVNGGNVTSVGLTLNGVASPNMLWVGLYSGTNNNDTTMAVSDNVNAGAYSSTTLKGITNDGDTIQQFFKANSGSGNVTITATRGSTSGSYRMIVGEYNGPTSTPLDQQGQGYNAGSASASATTSGATTTANEVLIALVGTAGNDTFSAGSGFTTRGGSLTALGAGDKVVSATGSQTATFTVSPSDEWACTICTFAMGGGGGPTPHLLSTLGCGG